MKKVCKVLTLACLLAAILCCLAFHASAAEVVASGYCGGEGDGTNLAWELDGDGVLTVAGLGKMKAYSDYDQLPWYAYRNAIKHAVFQYGVTNVGQYAFYDYDNLITAAISDSVVSIDDGAFYYCSNLEAVDMGNSVESIGLSAFTECGKLSEITLPDSLTSIDEGAFNWCTSLEHVVIPSNVAKISSYAFAACTNLTSVVLHDRITMIGDRAFASCYNLKEIVIPNSVTYISYAAFYDCRNLTAIYFEWDAPYMPEATGTNSIFDSEVAVLYYIPGTMGWTNSSAYDKDAGTWNGCKLVPWEREGDILVSGYCGGEGDGRNLTWELNKDGELTIAGVGAMADYGEWNNEYDVPWYGFNSSVASVVIGNGVTNISEYAFYDCSALSSVTIPDSVKTIGLMAFARCCSLTDIIIPDGVTVIDDVAFMGCSGLTEIVIPNGVEVIGEAAFDGCPNLTSVYFEGNAPLVYNTSSDYAPSFEEDTTLYYIPGTTGWTDSDAYDAEAGTWNGYKLKVSPEECPPGDINADGETNLKDLTRLFQYLADWDVEVNEAVLDVNGDGSINLKDQTRLFQYLADWDVEIYPAG